MAIVSWYSQYRDQFVLDLKHRGFGFGICSVWGISLYTLLKDTARGVYSVNLPTLAIQTSFLNLSIRRGLDFFLCYCSSSIMSLIVSSMLIYFFCPPFKLLKGFKFIFCEGFSECPLLKPFTIVTNTAWGCRFFIFNFS